MKKTKFAQQCTRKSLLNLSVAVWMLSIAFIGNISAQCVPLSNTISGTTFVDANFDGLHSAEESGQSNVMVTAYDADGLVAGSDVSDSDGYFQIDGLADGKIYQIVFSHNTGMHNAFLGSDNKSDVQYEESPSCSTDFGLSLGGASCGDTPQIVTTCFVQGDLITNASNATIVGLEHGFNDNSAVKKYATHGETGSVWGVAWKNSTTEMFSSAFVKFNSGLKEGPYAIFKTDISNNTSTTSKFVDVNNLLGGTLSGLTNTVIDDCAYGSQVGRVGLGNLVISPDESALYVALLDNNQVVAIDTENPTVGNTKVYDVPTPKNLAADKEWRVFALSHRGDKLYVGCTVTAAKSKKAADSRFVIMTLDLETEEFTEIFNTNYTRGYWQDAVPAALTYSQWLTDIEFTDEDYMLLGITDRLGHRYCRPATKHRLDQQFPDLLGVWYDQDAAAWTLEDNGSIGTLTGGGVGNFQGPGGGEFFANDFWPTDPDYHSETALGSILTIPGTGQVVAAVYDPLTTTYSGGLHRYRTGDGALLGVKQLYDDNKVTLFGKSTGFGDIVALCTPSFIEIGNLVWLDTNNDGVQNANESGIADLKLCIYNTECKKLGTTTTNSEGTYVFNNDNVLAGVYPNTTYYIEIESNLYDEATGHYIIEGDEYAVCAMDQGDNDDIDCDIILSDNDCLDGAYIVVNTNGTNHSFDLGLTSPRGFDLALTKTIVGDGFIRKDELVTFNITVYNQGGLKATKVGIVDEMPSGFSFDPADNLNWSMIDGKIKSYFENDLLPGAQVSRLIRLKAIADVNVDHVNYAEIFEAYGSGGMLMDDMDSTPDDIQGNDNGGVPDSSTDDSVDDDGTLDEDDQDPAVPKIFDLAVKVTLHEDKDYFPGESVKFDVTVYNQGNVDADSYALTQYATGGLVFDAAQSTGWTLINGKPTFSVSDDLVFGSSATYCIYYHIGEEITEGRLASFTEISSSIPVGSTLSFDFDSNPDSDEDNDNGAEADTNTDNYLQGNGDSDEDDHDIVIVRSKYADLALTKSIENERVKPGGTAIFTITVYNQGSQPIDKVTVTDYLPEGMLLDDDNWDAVNDHKATITVELDEPLYKDNSVNLTIQTKIRENQKAGALINFAEISAMSYKGEDLSYRDIDSTPDGEDNNDNGGNVDSETDGSINLSKLMDEDDHDPAKVIVIESELTSSVCLSNATDSNDGQYKDEFEIVGPSGDSWYVDFGQNYYMDTSPAPPAPPIPIVIGPGGVTFTEILLGGGLSSYTIAFIRLEGELGNVDFRNDQDDIESFEVGPQFYSSIATSGQTAICNGGTYTYTIDNPQGGVIYTWTLPGEGVFTGSSTGSSVEIDWAGTTSPASHILEVTADSGCIEPGSITVANGASSGAMFCFGNINLSLNSTCEVKVTPSMLLSGGMPAGTEYSVMLLDTNEEVIPDATLTADHIGQTITAKVIDGCSGNNCWTFILVEDKLKPTIECQDTEIACNKVTEYGGPFAEDNCGGEVIITMLQDVYTANNSCDSTYLGEFNRRYQATDAQGNKSEICDITIKVERVDLIDIIFPDNHMISTNNAINCLGYPEDEAGFPDPIVFGVPEYNNKYLYPHSVENNLCEIVADYVDVRIPAVGTLGGVVKIMRTWTVYEWCSMPSFTKKTQVLEITDTTPPIITSCPDDITVSATGGACEATFTMPIPVAYDECGGDNIKITTNYPGGAILDGQSRVVSLAFSLTPYEVTYSVVDEAGLITTCTSFVTVIDDVSPIAVCDGHTVVGLNSNGEGYVNAWIIDDGSYDACGIDSMKVQRVDAEGLCGRANTTLEDKVFFCCDDVGQTNMVRLVVWDKAGNSNSCMVNVEVQDKHAPEITTLADVTIECTDPLYPLSQFGTPTFNDACDVTLTIDSSGMLNSCNQGVITRTFTASDSEGSSTSTQRIYVINSTPFSIADVTHLPADYTTDGFCNMSELHPDSLDFPYSRPIYNTDNCDLVGDAFEDDVYTFGGTDNTCFKIIRTWYITDWCQEENEHYNEIVHTQIIKVTNSVKPVIVTEDIPTAFTVDCNEGDIDLSATGSDDCSKGDDLSWTADIFFDQEGVMEDTFDIRLMGTGALAIANGTYPIGTHYVKWTFTDACGNSESALQEFSIFSTTKPVLACVDLTVGLGPMDLDGDGTFDTEMACFNVDTMLSLVPMSSIYHPCDVPFELSLVSDSVVKKDTFDCADIGINIITIYAIDIFGNVTSCVFEIDVQDNNMVDICIDLKDCADVPPNGELEVGADCSVTVVDTSFDPTQALDDCGTLTFTHDYSVAGDPGYTGTNDNTTLEGAVFTTGEFSITWVISNGNQETNCLITIEVTDEIDPELTCTELTTFTDEMDGNEDCQHTMGSTALDPTATDNCDMEVSLTHDYSVAGDAGYTGTNDNTTLQGAVFPVGPAISITWTAVDDSDNEDTCTIQINVTDGVGPEMTCAEPTTFDDGADGNIDCQHAMGSTALDATAIDNCDDTDDITITHDFSVSGDAGYTGTNDNTTLQGAVFPIGLTTIVWTATDASGNSSTCTIMVTVVNSTPPALTCADDIVVNDNADGDLSCDHTMDSTAADPTVVDACGVASLVHNYSVTGDAGYTGTNDNTTLQGAVFPKGTTVVEWIATGMTGMMDTCTVTFIVNDEERPDCLVQDTLIVNIDISGAYVFSVADLSNPLVDNCDGTDLNYEFNPPQVTCDNAGDTLLVAFTAEDSSDNWSAGCPLIVIVSDAAEAQCNPIDITINLDENGEAMIVPSDVNDASTSACGITPVVLLSKDEFACNDMGPNDITIFVINGTDTTECVAIVTVVDTLFGPSVTCSDDATLSCEDLESMFDGDVMAWILSSPGITIEDNCPETPSNMYVVDTLIILTSNVCGFGQSTRTFTVTDQFGMTDQCVQIFTVSGPTDPLTQDDIDGLNLPTIVTINGCVDDEDLMPNNTNIGQITVDSLVGLGTCFDVTITFDDEVDGDGCERTVTRTWTITDACQEVSFTFVQVITVVDNMPPVLVGVGDITETADATTCMAVVTFDGLSGTDCNDFSSTNDSPHADDNNSINPEGTYPPGNFEILITSTDVCGNSIVDTVNLSVLDTSDLIIQCFKLFPQIEDNMMVITHPLDYLNITGGCVNDGSNFNFTFDFDDIDDTTRVWECEDIDSLFEGNVYWFDLAGNFVDSCLIRTRPVDPDNNCDMNIVGIGGNITTEAGVGIPTFDIDLDGAGMTIESNHNGDYAFSSMSTGGHYEVVPRKDGDDRVGVNGLDLLHIQRHILGLALMDSPYKIIAADINDDERITGADMLALRKLLLGITTSFAKNTSWRTVDAGYVFPDPLDPWAEVFPETYDIQSLDASMQINFIGVKVGDVDMSAQIAGKNQIESRNIHKTALLLSTDRVEGDLSTISMIATVKESIYGIQMSLRTADIDIIDIVSEYFTTSNIQYYKVSDDIYNVILTAPEGISISEGDVLAEIKVLSDSKIVLEDQFVLNTKGTFTSEAFIGDDLVGSRLLLKYSDLVETDVASLEVQQNRPNPWSDNTVITFTIPEKDEVSLSVFNIDGRLMYSASSIYEAGRNELELDSDMLPQTGIYYFQLGYRANVEQYKMIKID